jgi:hypothetical protein
MNFRVGMGGRESGRAHDLGLTGQKQPPSRARPLLDRAAALTDHGAQTMLRGQGDRANGGAS